MNRWMHIASNEAQPSPLHELQGLHARRLFWAIAILIVLAALLLPTLSLGQCDGLCARRYWKSGQQTHPEIWIQPYLRCS